MNLRKTENRLLITNILLIILLLTAFIIKKNTASEFRTAFVNKKYADALNKISFRLPQAEKIEASEAVDKSNFYSQESFCLKKTSFLGEKRWICQFQGTDFPADNKKVDNLINDFQQIRPLIKISANPKLYKSYNLDEKNALEAVFSETSDENTAQERETEFSHLFFGCSETDENSVYVRTDRKPEFYRIIEMPESLNNISYSAFFDTSLLPVSDYYFYSETFLKIEVDFSFGENSVVAEAKGGHHRIITEPEHILSVLRTLNSLNGSNAYLITDDFFTSALPVCTINIYSQRDIITSLQIYSAADRLLAVNKGCFSNSLSGYALEISSWTFEKLKGLF